MKDMKGIISNVNKNIPEEIMARLKMFSITIMNFLKNRESVIVLGDYAYNYFMDYSQINKSKDGHKFYKFIDNVFFEIISTNYVEDTTEIFNTLKKNYPELSGDFTLVEFYPFWMLLGYSNIIYYKNIPILHTYYYNKRCIPIRKVEFKLFDGDKAITEKSTIQLGAYDLNILYNLIVSLRYRTLKDDMNMNHRLLIISNFRRMRNYYFKKNKKNMFDNTLFQEFILDCVGNTVGSSRNARLEKEKKAKQGKLIIWNYRPEREGIKEPISKFKFQNTSGNNIRNPHNFKILPKNTSIDNNLGDEENDDEFDEETD